MKKEKMTNRFIGFFMLFVMCASCLCTVSAYAQYDNRSALNVLGIHVLEGYGEHEAVSKEALEQLIAQVTGKAVTLADNRLQSVLRGFIGAVGYEHKLAAGEPVRETAIEIGLLQQSHDEGAVTRAVAEELAAACLDICPMVQTGTELDPMLQESKETLAESRFGAHYGDGLVSGSYRDGVKRSEPLWKDTIEIEGERYTYAKSEGMTGRKIEFAYLEENGHKTIVLVRNKPDIVIADRTGHAGREFFRRGIPFREGELYSENDIYLKAADGTVPPVQTEVMERYSDGSIKWMSMAFMWDVEPGKEYPFYLIFDRRSGSTPAVSAASTGAAATLKNETLEAKIGASGIYELTYNGRPVIQNEGIRLRVGDGKNTYYFTVKQIAVVTTGPVYAQLRLSGVFLNTNMLAEWFITMYQGDDRLYHEVKFNAKGDNVLYSEAIEIDFAEDFTKRSYAEDAKQGENLTFSTWFGMHTENGRSVLMASKDIVRFEGVTSGTGVHNGFAHSEDSQVVVFSPIQYDLPWRWEDGVNRTVRLDMSFYENTPGDAEIAREESWAFTPPSMTINSERFVYAGQIDDNSRTEAFTRTEKLITSLYGRLWNSFEAGKFPHRMEVDYTTHTILGGAYDRSGGEVEYNLWKCYMNTGNPVLYDMLQESSEFWVDMLVYRGEIETLLGTNRYQTTDYNSVSFKTSMPFYGDLSGVYLSYCITGDPYYRESFKLGIDHWERSVREGGGFPNVSYWYDSLGFNEQSTYRRAAQFRFCAQVRGLYFAYELFGDEKYYDAAKSIISFLEELQNENGSFFEQYSYLTKEPQAAEKHDDGTPALSDKMYIMEYGARMLMDFYNDSGYEPTLVILEKLADYLLPRTEKLGYGWSPNYDDSIWVAANQRGAGSDPCGLTLFSEMYMATGNDEYLEYIARAFRFYTGSWAGGNTSRDMETGYSTFLKASQTISRMIKDNAEKVAEMGYPDVVALVQTETKERNDLYPEYRDEVVSTRNNRHSLNVFETPYGRVAYLYNCELESWPNDKEPSFDTEFRPTDDTTLWYGTPHTVNEAGVSVKTTIKVVDNQPLMETGFKLLDFSGELAAEVTDYTKDTFRVTLSGNGPVVFSLTDCFFTVDDDFTYTIKAGGEERTVSAKDGIIIDSLTLDGETAITIARQ